jgi:hypothetical protein
MTNICRLQRVSGAKFARLLSASDLLGQSVEFPVRYLSLVTISRVSAINRHASSLLRGENNAAKAEVPLISSSSKVNDALQAKV